MWYFSWMWFRGARGSLFAHNNASITLFNRLAFGKWGCLHQVAELDGVNRTLLVLGRPLP